MTTFVGSLSVNEKAAGVTSVNLTLPAGTAAGDLAVAGQGGNSNTIMGTQTGWTTVLSKASTADTLAPNAYLGFHTVTATDISNGFVTLDNVTSAAGNLGGLILRQVTTMQDFTAAYLDKTATSSSFTFVAQTASMVGVCIIYLVSQATVATATMTPPTTPANSWTEDADRTAGRNMSMGHLIWAGSGSTGTMTVTSGATTRGVGLMMGLQPAYPFENLTPTPRYN